MKGFSSFKKVFSITVLGLVLIAVSTNSLAAPLPLGKLRNSTEECEVWDYCIKGNVKTQRLPDDYVPWWVDSVEEVPKETSDNTTPHVGKLRNNSEECEVWDYYIKDNVKVQRLPDDYIIPWEDDKVVTPSSSSQEFNEELSGTEMEERFRLRDDLRYWKVWLKNEGTNDIIFSVSKGKDTKPIYLDKCGKGTWVMSSEKKEKVGTYYANYTSGKAEMKGRTACRIATTLEELDL